jgi:hypothetical protein
MDVMDCGCFGGGEGNRERLILVKGSFCFVFVNERSPVPKYAIALKEIRAQVKQPASSGHVFLETILGDVEYELTFATEAIAQEFVDVVREQNYAAATGLVRNRLGHDHLQTKSPSVRNAEAVALETLAEMVLSD